MRTEEAGFAAVSVRARASSRVCLTGWRWRASAKSDGERRSRQASAAPTGSGAVRGGMLAPLAWLKGRNTLMVALLDSSSLRLMEFVRQRRERIAQGTGIAREPTAAMSSAKQHISQLAIPHEEPDPKNDTHVATEQDVGEERIFSAKIYSDRAAKVACQQYRTEHPSSWNRVEQRADQL